MPSLKKLLKDHHITQENVAKKLKVHQTLISQWCCGKGKPNIFHLQKLAKILDVPVEKILACFNSKNT